MALDVILRLFAHVDVGSASVRWNVTLLMMWAVQWQPGGGSDRVRACEQRAHEGSRHSQNKCGVAVLRVSSQPHGARLWLALA
jgi:hypothetical protein